MVAKHLKHIAFSAACLMLLLGWAGAAHAQQFDVTGFGLSGSGTVLDSVVSPTEIAFVVLAVDVPAGWDISGVARQDSTHWQVRALFYDTGVPSGDPSSAEYLSVDSLQFSVNDGVSPQRVEFRLAMPDVIGANIRSVQFVLMVYGTDSDGDPHYSEAVSSFLEVSGVPPVNNSVDAQHAQYLRIEELIPSQPTITSPEIGSDVGRVFTVHYDQPLSAVARSLRLEIRETGESGIFEVHQLYLADTVAGADKQVTVNSLNLAQSQGVDSVTGVVALNHLSRLRFQLFYEIADAPGGPADPSPPITDVVVDLLTETPQLVEPRVGSEAVEPNVRVIYVLPEDADTVQLIFEVDSLTRVADSLSPHILTIVPDFIREGEHYFNLDGTQIGTGGPNVLLSNNGLEDALVEQALYNVTLSIGDQVGNPVRTATNYGYIWPEDLTTVPPRILAPLDNGVDNSTFWIQFELPEVPLPGSVELRLFGIPVYPGSQHVIHLGGLSAAGVHGLYLNGRALDLSGPPVTSVEGGNQLQHRHTYNIFVFYKDQYGNDEASSTFRRGRYDDATDAPTILTPAEGDSFRYAGTEFRYSQPETAAPGTLRLIIEQTGGPEHDLYSPHVLYLSDLAAGDEKSVVFQPTFLGSGIGIDSVTNPGSLVPRGIYRLTIAYQDTLLNEVTSVFVRDIFFPSGSSVVVSGSVISTEIIPGASHVPLLQFNLSSIGESSMRGLTLAVEGGLQPEDIFSNRMIVWSSVDSLLQTELDTPLDTLDAWISGPMRWDSLAVPLSATPRHVIVSASFRVGANPANEANLVLLSGDDVDCGGDPVLCLNCPIGLPDIPLPVLVSSMYLEDDTTFNSLVVNWIVESEYNTLGFRLWRYDDASGTTQAIASYATDERLYGRGSAATAKRYFYPDQGLRVGVNYTYSLEVISADGLTEFMVPFTATGTPSAAPVDFNLRKIYPNPFNQETTIEYVVPFSENVELTIYNLLGQPVRTIVNSQLAPAVYRSVWNGRNDAGLVVPSGLYLVRLKAAGRFDMTHKVLLVR
ncbi:MAG: T9SS type A sorting domain-containing protein [bacterium]|nr:T9SS type A sorting domain-containing protein [bacterium]